MKLYHISQTENRGWDTFSDLVVCAESEEDAQNIHPLFGNKYYDEKDEKTVWSDKYSGWCNSPDKVKVKYIGEAAEDIQKGIICVSFHAG